jgi:hypothetical protein
MRCKSDEMMSALAVGGLAFSPGASKVLRSQAPTGVPAATSASVICVLPRAESPGPLKSRSTPGQLMPTK